MATRYLKSDGKFTVRMMSVDENTAILQAVCKASKTDPCAGQNEVVGIVNGRIPRGWKKADMSHACDTHSGGFASIKIGRRAIRVAANS